MSRADGMTYFPSYRTHRADSCPKAQRLNKALQLSFGERLMAVVLVATNQTAAPMQQVCSRSHSILQSDFTLQRNLNVFLMEKRRLSQSGLRRKSNQRRKMWPMT